MRDIGVDPDRIGYHSFRKTLSTLLKSAQMQGGDNAAIMAQTRHRTEEVLTTHYIDADRLPTRQLFSRIPSVFPSGVLDAIGKNGELPLDNGQERTDSFTSRAERTDQSPGARESAAGSSFGCRQSELPMTPRGFEPMGSTARPSSANDDSVLRIVEHAVSAVNSAMTVLAERSRHEPERIGILPGTFHPPAEPPAQSERSGSDLGHVRSDIPPKSEERPSP